MAKKYKLDEIDRKILNTLQSNGRISNIELSSIVGISPSPCLRRVKALEEEGFITGFYATLNYALFNYNLIVYASVVTKASNPKEFELFEQAITAIPNILEIYGLSNNTDYLIKIVAKDELDYHKLINESLGKVPFLSKVRTTKISKEIKRTTAVLV